VKRPLSSRLAEVRHRLDMIGDDGDAATVGEAIALAVKNERATAEGAQVALEVGGEVCAICGEDIAPAREAMVHEEAGWTKPRAQGGTNALRGRSVTGRRAHERCVTSTAGQDTLS
jgi:hypothetical protein